MDVVVTKLIENGVIGALLVGACFVIWRLYKALEQEKKDRTKQVEEVQKLRVEDGLACQSKLNDVHKDRIDDAKAYQAQLQAQLVELIRDGTEAIGASTGAHTASKEAFNELRGSFDKLTTELRNSVEKLSDKAWRK